MKVLGSIFTSVILLMSIPVWVIAADLGNDSVLISQNSVDTTTETDNDSVLISQNSVDTTTETDDDRDSVTTVSFNRADLSKPHILRVSGMLNNALVPMERVEVKMNGKVVKTIANGSLELDLAPMMTAGRYEVDVSGKSPKLDTAISLYFTGTHIKIDRQSSGTGKIDLKLIINVQ